MRKKEGETTVRDTDNAGDYALTREELFRRAVAGGVLVGTGSLAAAGSAFASRAPTASLPKRGGTLRHGGTLASPAWKNLDAHTTWGWTYHERNVTLYDGLVEYSRDGSQVQGILAEELTQEKPDTWLIRVKPGITFHNGKSLTIDDVIFSLRRIIDPKLASFSASTFASVDPNGFTKLDQRTARMKLKRPDVTFADACTGPWTGIVPVGYDPNNPVGTGPFMFKSYTPGVQSVQVRNPNFWQTGLPYLDELVILDLADPSARLNALLSGQVETVDHVSFAQVPLVRARKELRILEAVTRGGTACPFGMRVDYPPFNNNNVRQALRLVADRQQMVRLAIAGHGHVGNDIFAGIDPCYNSSLPQRKQDLDRAKFLLRRAGHEKLKVTLVVSDFGLGGVAAAQVYAEQAKGAGVTVNVRKVDPGIIYGPNYLKWPFANPWWGQRRYLIDIKFHLIPSGLFNETHWPDAVSRRRYLALFAQANKTLDQGKRCGLIHEMQKMEWQRGGYIVWGFSNNIDAYNTKITGLRRNPGEQLSLDRFNMKEVYFV
jgi:peptide/nickel transport system substrate-binding protein